MNGSMERVAIRGGLQAGLADMKDMFHIINRMAINSGCFGCNVGNTTGLENIPERKWAVQCKLKQYDPFSEEGQSSVIGKLRYDLI
jgi:hypothetical protein